MLLHALCAVGKRRTFLGRPPPTNHEAAHNGSTDAAKYQREIIKRYGVRAVIGKGGMGAKTLAALKDHGAVYLNAVGGAAQFYARSIKAVDGVSLLEFGTPEAMWHLTVEHFPAIVTMDSHGNSLHRDIEQESGKHLEMIGG